MKIKQMAHIALIVRDLARSRWFYGAVLGMEEMPRPTIFKFDGAWLRSGAAEIHLISADATDAPPGATVPQAALDAGMATHLAFEVDDLAAVEARLAAHGVAPAAGPMSRGDGFVQLYVQDPDGFLVEFCSWQAGSESDAPDRLPVRS